MLMYSICTYRVLHMPQSLEYNGYIYAICLLLISLITWHICFFNTRASYKNLSCVWRAIRLTMLLMTRGAFRVGRARRLWQADRERAACLCYWNKSHHNHIADTSEGNLERASNRWFERQMKRDRRKKRGLTGDSATIAGRVPPP